MVMIERYAGIRPKTVTGGTRGAAKLPRIGMVKIGDKLAAMDQPVTIGLVRGLMEGNKFRPHWKGFPQAYLDKPEKYPGRDSFGYAEPDDAKLLIDRLFARTGRRLRLPTFEEAKQYLGPIISKERWAKRKEIELICTSSMVKGRPYRDRPRGPVFQGADREAYYHPGLSEQWVSHDRGWGIVIWLVEDLKA